MKSAIILIALGLVSVAVCRTSVHVSSHDVDIHRSNGFSRFDRDVEELGEGVYRSSAEGSNAPSLNQAPGVTYVRGGGGNGPSLMTDDQGHSIAINGATKFIV